MRRLLGVTKTQQTKIKNPQQHVAFLHCILVSLSPRASNQAKRHAEQGCPDLPCCVFVASIAAITADIGCLPPVPASSLLKHLLSGIDVILPPVFDDKGAWLPRFDELDISFFLLVLAGVCGCYWVTACRKFTMWAALLVLPFCRRRCCHRQPHSCHRWKENCAMPMMGCVGSNSSCQAFMQTGTAKRQGHHLPPAPCQEA